MNKIPHLNFQFWMIEICAVALVAAGGGFLSKSLHLGVIETALVFTVLAFVLVGAQMTVKKLHAFLFWAAMLGVTSAGSALPELLQETARFGDAKDSALLAAVVAGVFLIWGGVGENFALEGMASRRAESLFWLGALSVTALGAALADYLEHDSGLDILMSAAISAAAVLLLGLVWRFTRLPRAVLFWPLLMFAQPFGRAIAGFLARTHDDHHGMGFGPVMTAALAGYMMMALIIIAMRREKQANASVEAPKQV